MTGRNRASEGGDDRGYRRPVVELFRVTEGDPGPVSAEIIDQY